MTFLQKAILKTICYFDLFDYPLTVPEIRKRLMGVKSTDSEIIKTIRHMPQISSKSGYYFLSGREENVNLRTERNEFTLEKIRKAERAVQLLGKIPWVKMVALTGTAAVSNAKENDDIDFFIITQKGFLWTVRFFSVLLCEIFTDRRHPDDHEVKDKICLNMYMDESRMVWEKDGRNIYTAYEIMQVKPLFERDNTYSRFLNENIWVKEFIPGIQFEVFENKKHQQAQKAGLEIPVLERILKGLQVWYMGRRAVPEKTDSGRIFFFKKDLGRRILSDFSEKYRKVL